MSVNLKSAEDIERMRVAGRLASELLDYLTPHVQAGVTTGEIDRLATTTWSTSEGFPPRSTTRRRDTRPTPRRCARR